ncbi:hypothetical protein HK100_003065 [Physocladia obscura]|uniref:JmjC domain-containing protein n=1 Tax=Physocladia obscura TaxID=109957 RepID=A0AAD5T6W5_9FUNG|nr:hypothetical protein HK100_003065 [Physocladia obscura]
MKQDPREAPGDQSYSESDRKKIRGQAICQQLMNCKVCSVFKLILAFDAKIQRGEPTAALTAVNNWRLIFTESYLVYCISAGRSLARRTIVCVQMFMRQPQDYPDYSDSTTLHSTAVPSTKSSTDTPTSSVVSESVIAPSVISKPVSKPRVKPTRKPKFALDTEEVILDVPISVPQLLSSSDADFHIQIILKTGKGDVCRFRGFRAFQNSNTVEIPKLTYGPWFVRKSETEIVPTVHTQNLKSTLARILAAASATISPDLPNTSLLEESFDIRIPARHTITSNSIHELYILKTTAPVLLSILSEELSILESNVSSGFPVVYRPPTISFNVQSDLSGFDQDSGDSPVSENEDEPSVIFRQHCDECLTSIFNTYYVCAVCGKEICNQCFHNLPQVVTNFLLASVIGANKNNSLACCIRKVAVHVKKQFMLVGKIPKVELEAMKNIAELVIDLETTGKLATNLEADEKIPPDNHNNQMDEEEEEVIVEEGSTAAPRGEKFLEADIKRRRKNEQLDVVGDSNNYLRLQRIDVHAYKKFQQQWKQGNAVVFVGCAGDIQAGWNAEYFMKHHGKEKTTVVDCVTKENIPMQVGEFFRYFTDAKLVRKKILKLPDWPSHSDFKEKFPNHFADFKRSVPFADYSSFTGPRNLAARLPQSFLPPDLGPKMYNAFGSSDGENVGKKGFGTTPIHLDMADAVNVMMHASTVEYHTDLSKKASTAAAVWDIYPLSTLPKLRAYLSLYAKKRGVKIDDPIHDQFFYMNESMREELYEEYGVRGWRIFQNPGDAVFVPAGCAHQVCNYMDCIKAACDFVSPENLRACVQLTGEFRKLSKTHRRREDLLNLKCTLWSVWTSCPLLNEDYP